MLINEVKSYVQKEFDLFFATNGNMQNRALLWNTFKAYIRGGFVNQKAYLNLKRQKAVDELRREVARLDAQCKIAGDRSKLELDTKTNELK